jgi:hypothetical protein
MNYQHQFDKLADFSFCDPKEDSPAEPRTTQHRTTGPRKAEHQTTEPRTTQHGMTEPGRTHLE